MMHYLNKQNFWVSYLDLGRQNKTWENNVFEEICKTFLLKGVFTHSSIDNDDDKSESISMHSGKLQFVSIQRSIVNVLS